MSWNTGLLSGNAANACRISAAPIYSNFWVILCKPFDIIKTDTTKKTIPIVKCYMLGGYPSIRY